MAESRLRAEKKARQRAEFARLSPAARLRLGAELSASGRALLVRETAPQADKTEPFRTLATMLELLKSARVPHALIGGWAVNVWGVSRATADVDLLASYPRPPTELLAELKRTFKAEWRPGDFDDPIDGLIRATAREAPRLPLDLLRAAKSSDRESLERAASVRFAGLEIPVVRPEDLIAMKLHAGGGLDWEDARAVYGVQKGRLDETLLEDACRRRKVLDRLELLRPRKA